jgi:hypothetical protein
MKRDEDKSKTQPAQNLPTQASEITSDSVENAHASGDGAVKKTDEFLSSEDNEETTTDTSSY